MPYYVYKMSSNDNLKLVTKLELLKVFDAFREAKYHAKESRAELSGDGSSIKVMFAENQLSAEEQLLEKREKPVLMEHER